MNGDSTHIHNHIGPPDDCTMCRLGELTVPTQPGDVRGWVEDANDTDGERWVKRYRSQVVRGDGPVPCPIMLIGEAPGFQEDRDGLGFRPSAPAGRVLAKVMDEVELCRWSDVERMYPGYPKENDPVLPVVYVTNALKCRPVDNKIDKFLDCLEVCRDLWLKQEIAAVHPKVIVALGKVAAQPWFGKEAALTVRQLSRDSVMLGPVVVDTWDDDDGVMVIHAPHPSYIARGATDARVKLVNALRLAKEIGYGS